MIILMVLIPLAVAVWFAPWVCVSGSYDDMRTIELPPPAKSRKR